MCLAVHHRVKMAVSKSSVCVSAYLNENFKLILSICLNFIVPVLYFSVPTKRWVKIHTTKIQWIFAEFTKIHRLKSLGVYTCKNIM